MITHEDVNNRTNKTRSIFRYEFVHTVRRTGFIVLTLLPPVLALVAIGVYRIVSASPRPAASVTRVGFVAEAGQFDQFLAQGRVTFIPFETVPQARRALTARSIKEYLVIPADFLSSGRVRLYVTQRELSPPPQLAAAVKSFISSNLLAGKVPPAFIERVEQPIEFQTTTLTASGEVASEQGGYGNFIIPAIFSLLLALSLNFSSAYMLQGLAEEKENRLIEVLLSSVSPRQLLFGKVFAYGSAGLAQVAVWIVSLALVLLLAASSIGGLLASIRVPVSFWILAVVYFILGYSLFTVLSASVAAVSRTVREASGIMPLYSLFSVAPFWFLSLLMIFPDKAVWIVFTIFPLSAPVLTLLRLGLSGVPAWQLAASVAVLLTCIVLGLILAARLLGLYLLVYGRRPKLAEIFGAVVQSTRQTSRKTSLSGTR